jgi:hypothetical protein
LLSSDRLHHSRHCRMRSVLHLHPMRRPPAAIGPTAALRNQSLQPHDTGCAEEVRPDGTDLEGLMKMLSCRPRMAVTAVTGVTCLLGHQRQRIAGGLRSRSRARRLPVGFSFALCRTRRFAGYASPAAGFEVRPIPSAGKIERPTAVRTVFERPAGCCS